MPVSLISFLLRTVPQCRNTHSDIFSKFLIRIFRISGVLPDIAGHLTAFPAMFHSLAVHGAVVNRAALPFRRMKNLSAAVVTARTHFSIAIACAAVCSAHTDYRIPG